MAERVSRYSKRLAEKALAGFRSGCSNRAAARASGVCENTIRRWRKRHPDFEEQVQVATRYFQEHSGREAVEAIRDHVAAVLRGDVEEIVERESGTKDGKPVDVVRTRHERIKLNPALVRMAVTKFDASYTHPKQEVEHSGSMTLSESVKAIQSRIDGDTEAD